MFHIHEVNPYSESGECLVILLIYLSKIHFNINLIFVRKIPKG
jgi:hypothetical protein